MIVNIENIRHYRHNNKVYITFIHFRIYSMKIYIIVNSKSCFSKMRKPRDFKGHTRTLLYGIRRNKLYSGSRN